MPAHHLFFSFISPPPQSLFCKVFYYSPEFFIILLNFTEFILIFGEIFGFCGLREIGSAYQSIPNGVNHVTFSLLIIRQALLACAFGMGG